VSESVPDTTQLPECRVPVVLIAPEDETTTPQATDVVTKLTRPAGPFVASWLVNADEPVVVTVPVAGPFWVRATAVVVRVKAQVPESGLVSESVPDTVQLPVCRVPVVLIAPDDETKTPQAVDRVVA
jgi:hypothetical protein